VARDRIIGVLLGNLVAYFTLVHVWPVTVGRRVDPALATAFRQLSKIVAEKAPRARQLLASQIQGTLRNTEADIELAHYEPVSIRSPATWLFVRSQVIATSQSLISLLLLSTDTSELSGVDVGRRLERLAMRLEGASDPEPVRPSAVESAHGWQTLPARVNRSLRALEQLLEPGARDTEASPDAHS